VAVGADRVGAAVRFAGAEVAGWAGPAALATGCAGASSAGLTAASSAAGLAAAGFAVAGCVAFVCVGPAAGTFVDSAADATAAGSASPPSDGRA